MALVEETTNMSLEDNENAHHDTEQVDGKVKTQEGDSAVQNGHNAPENKEKKKQEREVIPLEELTPVPKPDKAGYEKRINELNQKIEHIKEEKNKVHTKIEEKREASKGLREKLKEARDRLNEIKAEQDKVRAQKQALLNKLDSLKSGGESSQNSRIQELKAELRFWKVEDVDKKARELEEIQSTRSLTLAEEKNLVKEISELRQQRQKVAELEELQRQERETRDQNKQKISELRNEISKVSEDFNAVKARHTSQYEVMKNYKGELDARQDGSSDLVAKRNKLKQELDDTFTELKQVRSEFREADKKYRDYYYAYKRAKAAQRQAEMESKKKEEEQEMKELEEESKPSHPYAEKITLCNVLENYLRFLIGLPRVNFEDPEGTKSGDPRLSAYMNVNNNNKSDQEESAVDPSTVANMKTVGKRIETVEEDPVLSALMGGGRKKKGKGKKKSKDDIRPVKHSFDDINSFHHLGITPPKDTSEVNDTIRLLQSKRQELQEAGDKELNDAAAKSDSAAAAGSTSNE